MKRFILTFFILSIPFISKASTPLVLTEDLQEVCLCRDLVSYFEDTSGNLTISDVLKLEKTKAFKESKAADLINENISSAYWLSFHLRSQTNEPFIIELFDFDIDEISLFIPDEKGFYKEYKAGYTVPFDSREINHKNLSFKVALPEGTTQNVFMRFKSSRYNVMEPIVRSYDKLLDYGFTEYLLFGLFYGLMLLMIFYNFLYFILLRKSYFLYYVIFGSGILSYIVAENGTGFQYLWPEHPEFNPYSSLIGLFIGIMAMLLFTFRFLHLKTKGPSIIKKAIIASIFIRTIILGIQLLYPDYSNWKILDIFFIQIALIAGITRYQYRPAKWYIIAFILLDTFFLISGLEQIGLLPSSIFTVYSFNIGIVLNFIFLSIGIGESIQEIYKKKNEADAKLILEYKKNDELKGKINRELEQLVKERTVALEKQNTEIQEQKEEIRTMNECLEELVKERTSQLEEQNFKIKEYSFSNSHLVRAPLARILGLINIIKIENNISMDLFLMIETNAKELDVVIREMNRILDEN